MAKKDIIDREDDERDIDEAADEEPVDEEPDEEKPAKEEPKAINKIAYERELRRYVRSDGGYRKGMPDSGIKRAKEIMKVLGRKKPEWDHSILVPGYDKPTVRNMNLGTGSKG